MSESGRLLIVDDDTTLLQLLELRLSLEGYDVASADNGLAALRWFFEHRPDLVILDIMLPEMNGWNVCQRIREVSDVPILMLTALHEPEERIRGFDLGADDYLVKPFDVQELTARVRAILRRARLPRPTDGETRVHNSYTDGHLCIDLTTRSVMYDGEPIHLTPQEFKLLSCFVRHPGLTLSHDYLLYQVWGLTDGARGYEYLKTYIRYLRRKIEPDPQRPAYILTEHGLGYRLALPAGGAGRK